MSVTRTSTQNTNRRWQARTAVLTLALTSAAMLPASTAADADATLAQPINVQLANTVAFTPALAAAATPKTRNRKFNVYNYECAQFSPTATLETAMIGSRHFVYEGWNWEESFDGGKTWLYAASWVYPFGQTGPKQITKQFEYPGDFTLSVIHRPCPPR